MEKPYSGYKNLILWKEVKQLVLLVYKITENFPRSEEFGLKSQMRRAAISILSQIAEGWLRNTVKDKLHFLNIALGSLLELEAQAEISKESEKLEALEKEFNQLSKNLTTMTKER